MIKYIIKFLTTITLISLLFAVSCKEKVEVGTDTENYRALFLGYEDFGAYIESSADLVYNKIDHQIYQSGDKMKFFISNDMATTYLKISFASDPNEGGVILSTIRYSQSPNVITEANLEVINSDEAKLWLWDNNKSIGVIVLK